MAFLLLSSSACGAGSAVTPGASSPVTAASPLVFASTIYPYRLTLPAGVTYGSWTAATRQWRPDAPFFTGSSTNDEASTVEGRLFIVGAPWSGTLRDFETRVGNMMAQDHDCKAPVVRKEITLGTSPAIGIAQTCGTTDLVFTRVLVVHEAYALAISLGPASQAKTASIVDVLAGWLKGLTWASS